MTSYRVYDVFTDAAFGGNPLAVFPDATNIPEAKLQKIAREFNFSETTFVYPAVDPAHTAKVRIFTPTRELQFAGHPTIGTAVCLSDLGHTGPMVLELGVGPIPCDVSGQTASFTTSAPLDIIATPEPELVAAAIGLKPDAISNATHVPTQASLGLAFVFVELKTRDDLRACHPVAEASKIGAARYPAGIDFAVFTYVRNGDHLDARMFAPLDNMPEDPATGSACATITALLSQIARKPLAFTIHQGDDMGRPSRIKAAALAGDPHPIKITGDAVLTMEGHFVG
ncbi:trans-2,3-dihydro-3-hydroxyanthranilate isomerase [Loktanella ponticola]|uniref:Trans-2,3-dihydro-3-hydroxyanthranilate isomerase n=1 Tax=Yoonia ponticola TaxID=1524255 RepID=A0A7W9EXE7_9RHOB|nr:PhzF family phenazine biosynthesis protein [Yoonia ponticola]MBB5721657.1 trans-2,3-dihydro-3-hydroxyanthranilate isomerase [Yoonia ponticola]